MSIAKRIAAVAVMLTFWVAAGTPALAHGARSHRPHHHWLWFGPITEVGRPFFRAAPRLDRDALLPRPLVDAGLLFVSAIGPGG
jgi:hypothetical protein